jgi:hypothetical protein
MRIGLVSDTHLPRFGRRLPAALVAGLEGVDLILHMGDFTHPLAIPLFEAIAPVEGVAGNNDGPELVERFGWKRIVEAGGVRIGMTHGHWPDNRLRTVEKAVGLFEWDDLDVVCFGHSHVPCLEQRGALWIVNPGSPTDKRRQPRYSFGLLDIADGRVTPSLHYFDSKE